MDWFSQLEHRRGSVIFALLLIVISTLAVSSMRERFAYDGFWHLKMGEDWIEHDLSPWQDHYSITHQGEPVRSPPYLFQVLLYKTVGFLGINAAFKALVFVCLTLVIVMMMVWLKFVKAPVTVYLLALPMLVVALQMRASVRPELLAFSLMVLCLILYERARVQPDFKRFLAIALMMLAFTNYHSAILGYVIFFGLFVDLALEQARNRAPLKSWIPWAAWGLVIVGVGFLRPDFSHPVIGSFQFSDVWRDLVLEYRSPWQGLDGSITFSLVVVAAATLIMLLRQRLYGYAVVCAIFTWYATQYVRMVTPAGIVVLCLFTLALSRVDTRALLSTGSAPRRAAIACAWGVLFVVPLLVGVLKGRAMVLANQFLQGYFPEPMVQYMKEQGMQGRIFNDYAIGGYLLYHLAPESQVYIDGRTEILYPAEHAQRWADAIVDPAVLSAEIEKHGIDYVVVSNRPEHIQLMRDVDSMRLDFADLRYSLYARENANFPVSGSIWSKPWCWDEDMGDRIQQERIKALFIVPQYSLLLPIIALAADYSASTDRRAFIESMAGNDDLEWFDDISRFAAYRALELEMYGQAGQFLSAVEEKEPKDFLAMALASARLGHFRQAEELLVAALPQFQGTGGPDDYLIFHGILNELRSGGPLELISESELESISRWLKESGQLTPAVTVTAQHFCEEKVAQLRPQEVD